MLTTQHLKSVAAVVLTLAALAAPAATARPLPPDPPCPACAINTAVPAANTAHHTPRAAGTGFDWTYLAIAGAIAGVAALATGIGFASGRIGHRRHLSKPPAAHAIGVHGQPSSDR
jgi:hypothetical protein